MASTGMSEKDVVSVLLAGALDDFTTKIWAAASGVDNQASLTAFLPKLSTKTQRNNEIDDVIRFIKTNNETYKIIETFIQSNVAKTIKVDPEFPAAELGLLRYNQPKHAIVMREICMLRGQCTELVTFGHTALSEYCGAQLDKKLMVEYARMFIVPAADSELGYSVRNGLFHLSLCARNVRDKLAQNHFGRLLKSVAFMTVVFEAHDASAYTRVRLCETLQTLTEVLAGVYRQLARHMLHLAGWYMQHFGALPRFSGRRGDSNTVPYLAEAIIKLGVAPLVKSAKWWKIGRAHV